MGFKSEDGLTMQQENAARLLVNGALTDKQVAEVVGCCSGTITKWKTNRDFCNFVDMLRSEINFGFLQNATDSQVDEVAKKILNRAKPVAALRIAHSIENDEAPLANASAKWLLEKSGYGEKKTDKNVNINIDMSAEEFKEILEIEEKYRNGRTEDNTNKTPQ